MDDKAILDLYWHRSEAAIAETDQKYGAYCFCIANNILNNREDSQESVNDTYLAAWNTIPPKRPAVLAAFLDKITRCISLDRWKQRSRLKRAVGKWSCVWKNWRTASPAVKASRISSSAGRQCPP